MDHFAERAILGAVLLGNSVLSQAADLKPSDFQLSAHGLIFACIRDLQSLGVEIDMSSLVVELDRRGELERVGGVAYVSSLIDGTPDRNDIKFQVQTVRANAGRDLLAKMAEALSQRAQRPDQKLSELMKEYEALGVRVAEYERDPYAIRTYGQIPDLLERATTPIEWVVQDVFPRKSVTLWAGSDGVAKTYLAQSLAIAVASGGFFLGRQCHQSPVLYFDYENPDYEVRARLLKRCTGPIANLKVWGQWLDQKPPAIGGSPILELVKEKMPLLIFDPFRYAHAADENDSTEMTEVMRHLRSYATEGATVVVLHHVAKSEGSSGRGSSAIRGAVDIAYVQEIEKDGGRVTFTCVKNRFGPKPVFTCEPDFSQGTFNVVQAESGDQDEGRVRTLWQVIEDNPGTSQNDIAKKAKMRKETAVGILKAHEGVNWRSEPGEGRSRRYFTLRSSAVPEPPGTTVTPCSAVPSL